MKRFALLFSIAILSSFVLTSLNNDKGTRSLPLEGDSYKVIRVNGKIVFSKSGNSMKTGDVFASSESLDFSTTDSRAAVISKKRGRFVLTSKIAGNQKANLIPAMNNISSRAGALLNKIDLQNHFKGKYVVLGNQKLKIGDKAYPLTDSKFFYLQYEYNGEVIRKKLNHTSGNHLLINAENVFKVDGKQISVEEKSMQLYYRDSESKKSENISTFTPVFPNLEELKVELEVIKTEYAEKNSKELKGEFTAYINQFYGKPDSDNLSEFLIAKMGMK
jgi:hypothetical protein